MPTAPSPLRLYAPPRPPGARRDEILVELDAPPDGGVFETWDFDLAREAVSQHLVAAVDPPGDFAVGVLIYWCLRFDPIGKCYVGPGIYFDPDDFAAPVMPAGLPADNALSRYLAAAPVPLPPPPDRLSVPFYRRPPDPLWRRTLPVPRTPGLRDRRDCEVSREAVAGWYDRLQTEAWRRFAIHRFFTDLAAGALVAFDSQNLQVPRTFWDSDVSFGAGRGDLFAPSDNRIPLRPCLRIYSAEGAKLHRQAIVASFGTIEAAVVAAVAQHGELLEGRRQVEKERLLAERLPGISVHAIAASLRRLAAE